MKMKRIFMGFLAAAVVVSTIAMSVFADSAALIAGEDRYVDTLSEAFTEAGNPNQKQVLMAKDWTGNIDIEYPGFSSSFYINGYKLDGDLKITEASIINLYGIEPGNKWAGEASIITGTVYQNSTANINIGGDTTFDGNNGVSLVATAGKVAISSDNVTFKGDIKSTDFAIVKIAAGTYDGNFVIDTASNLEITGGSFKNDPSAFLPAGYMAVKADGEEYYTIEAPTGSLDDLTKNAEGKYVLSTPTDIVRFRTVMSKQNIATGTEFVLANNIDMSGITLAPAGNDSIRFSGIFDGQNNTISNITIDGEDDAYVAFFGNTSGATIKNLTLENVTVDGGEYTAGLVGRARNTTVDNCKVIGEIAITGSDAVGAVVGGGVANVTGCEVKGDKGSFITGKFDVAGVSGLVSAGTTYVDDNSVSGVTITATRGYAGGIAGRVLANSASGNNLSISENTLENAAIVSGDTYSSGIILGVTVASEKSTVSYTGNAVSGTKLTIDGVESNELYAGTADSDNITIPVAKIGTEYYNTLKAAISAITDDTTITLVATVKDENVKLPAVLRNFTINGNGMTVKNTTINAADGNSVDYQGFTVTNTVFDNSRFVLGGMRSGNVIYKDLVFTGNIFKNIVNTGSLAAIHMNIGSEDNEYIENFTFTGNTIDGVTGSANSGVLMKNAKGNIVFTDNTIVNVANNAIQCINAKSDINLVIKDNVLEGGGSTINLYNVPAATLDNNVTPDGEPVIVGNFKAVAKIGDKQFATLAAAIAGAQNGDTIDLLGNTFEVTSSATAKGMIAKGVTLQNGTMDFTNAVASNSLFDMTANQTIKFKDMTLLIKDRDQKSDMCYWMDLRATTAVAYFENCFIDFDAIQYSYISGNGHGNAYFTDCRIEAEQGNFVYMAGAHFDNCTFDGYAGLSEGEAAGNIINHAAVDCEIKNSTVATRRLGVNSGDIAIVNSNVRAATVAPLNSTSIGLVSVDADSTLDADDIVYSIIDTANSKGTITSSADSIEVRFVKADVDATGADTKEDEDLYNINLVGAKSETINRLNSVDLTFALTNDSGKNIYEIIASNNEVVINNVSENRYEFHYDGKTNTETDTANTITIGQVKITGFGTYDFAVNATVDTNVAHATTLDNNIVDTYVPNGDTTTVVDGELVIDNGIRDVTIAVPTRTLTINVDFPNAVEKKVADYQKMTVTVSGGDLEKAIEIKLGDASYTETIDLENEKAAAAYEVTVSDGYTVEVTNALTLNTAYTVTVEGAGYRTYRYTVTMTEAKTLNFWNNVKDNETVVENGKKTDKVTYLAGDIVKDSLINIYDLSAVVSYFGETGLVGTNNDYAKYDLNRDGKIDSKDVAYVLVSWGN